MAPTGFCGRRCAVAMSGAAHPYVMSSIAWLQEVNTNKQSSSHSAIRPHPTRIAPVSPAAAAQPMSGHSLHAVFSLVLSRNRAPCPPVTCAAVLQSLRKPRRTEAAYIWASCGILHLWAAQLLLPWSRSDMLTQTRGPRCGEKICRMFRALIDHGT